MIGSKEHILEQRTKVSLLTRQRLGSRSISVWFAGNLKFHEVSPFPFPSFLLIRAQQQIAVCKRLSPKFGASLAATAGRKNFEFFLFPIRCFPFSCFGTRPQAGPGGIDYARDKSDSLTMNYLACRIAARKFSLIFSSWTNDMLSNKLESEIPGWSNPSPHTGCYLWYSEVLFALFAFIWFHSTCDGCSLWITARRMCFKMQSRCKKPAVYVLFQLWDLVPLRLCESTFLLSCFFNTWLLVVRCSQFLHSSFPICFLFPTWRSSLRTETLLHWLGGSICGKKLHKGHEAW